MATNTISEPRVSKSQRVPATPLPSEIRYEQLDGLRGIAALVVFVFHAIMIAPPNMLAVRVLATPVLRPLWDGPGAVMLFFVLSGFVLTLPYTGAACRTLRPFPFVIKRVTRLYPAYWAVLLISLALRSLVFEAHGLSGLSSWAAMHWSRPIGWPSLAMHIFMISPGLRVDDIDPVIWSLVIEMKVSVIFPLLVILVTRTKQITYAGLALLLSISLSIPLHSLTHTSSSWSRAVLMIPMFLTGSYLARYRTEAAFALRSSRALRFAVGIIGALLYGAVWIVPLRYQSVARIGCAFGSAACIVLFMVSPCLQRIGTARLTTFLGKVSYSFYLVHLPILIALASLLYPLNHSLTTIILASLVCSLVAAWGVNSAVEVPAHNWGKRLAASLTVGPTQARPASIAH